MDTVYTDFQKAFNKVNHEILIDKIKRKGATEGVIKVIVIIFGL